jgi:alpha-L-fucosidase
MKKLGVFIGLALVGIFPVCAQDTTGLAFNAQEPEYLRNARMEWFRDAHFGMFVHWGLYSVAEGIWNGKDYATNGGAAEWLQNAANVPADVYAKTLTPLFRPKKDFAREWARMAKDAGCRYVIFTSRHHEGFALHDSKTTTFDGMDVTGRDLAREIINALHEQGLRVGIYFSLLDWHHPDAYVEHGLPAPGNVKNEDRDNSKYVEYMYQQAEELFSNYGPVDVVWWDYSSEEIQGEKWGARKLVAMVKAHQPNIIMNNRLYAFEKNSQFTRANGDLVTPEQHIPETGFKGMDWESCMTMNGTWGYSRNNQNWRTPRELIRNMADIVSKGGNYLLNVGPMGDGTVPARSIELMHSIGQWMRVNGESIYGTRANTIGRVAWGRITTRPGRSYLHVFNWPADGRLHVPLAPAGGSSPRAWFLADSSRKELPLETSERGIDIDISNKAFKDDDNTVIVLEAEGRSLAALGTFPEKDGTFRLVAGDAALKGDRLALSLTEEPYINTWMGADSAEWKINVPAEGKYKLVLNYACTDQSAGSTIHINAGPISGRPSGIAGAVLTTGGWDAFRDWSPGILNLSKGVNRLLVAGAPKPGMGVMNLKYVRLIPVEKH